MSSVYSAFLFIALSNLIADHYMHDRYANGWFDLKVASALHALSYSENDEKGLDLESQILRKDCVMEEIYYAL